jgi:hypothetical protein
MEEKTYLFLDDIRMPAAVGNYMMPIELRPMYRIESWEIVRTYEEFKTWILDNGLPDVISFDHDIADVHYDHEAKKESFEYYPETGYDCAKWLVEFCLHEKLPLPEYYVHSMNPVGAENIEKYMEGNKERCLLQSIAEKLKGKELFPESNARAREILSKSRLPEGWEKHKPFENEQNTSDRPSTSSTASGDAIRLDDDVRVAGGSGDNQGESTGDV